MILMNSLKFRINKELIRGSKIEKPKRPPINYFHLELDSYFKTLTLFDHNHILFNQNLNNSKWISN